jgi:hypothetical protein
MRPRSRDFLGAGLLVVTLFALIGLLLLGNVPA